MPDPECIATGSCSPTVKAAYAVRFATLRNGQKVVAQNSTDGINRLAVPLTVSDGVQMVGTISPGDFFYSYDGTNAYFTHYAGEFCTQGWNELDMQKMNLSTGAKTTLMTGTCSSPTSSAGDGVNLYYVGIQNDGIYKKDIAGSSPPATLVTSAPNIIEGEGIFLDASRLYYAWGNTVRSIGKDGSGQVTLYTAPTFNYLRVLGIDGNSVYFDVPNDNYELHSVPLGGGASPLLHAQAYPHLPFDVHAGTLYFADNQGGDSQILSVPAGGGSPQPLYSRTGNCILGIDAGDTILYWSENQDCNGVQPGGRVRERTAQGFFGTEADNRTGPFALHVAGSELYWIDGGQSSQAAYRTSTQGPPSSCESHCGSFSGACWCDDLCTGYGDCCPDFSEECSAAASCDGHCGGQGRSGCWCDDLCSGYGDCCADFAAACP